jgi:large subunit ribosomal protein L23
MFRLVRSVLSPPKLPANNFFPWVNMTLHQSGTYLSPHRVCFRVPVHLTKFEIREYLRKVYQVKAIKVNTMIKLPKKQQNSKKQWYKMGSQYKKAYVTCEEIIPDSVKMMRSSKDMRKNPDLTSGFFVNSNIKPLRPWATRDYDWAPRHETVHEGPISLLMRDATKMKKLSRDKEKELQIDKRLPFEHFTKQRAIPENTPVQKFPKINLKLLRESRNSGKLRDSKGKLHSELVR